MSVGSSRARRVFPRSQHESVTITATVAYHWQRVICGRSGNPRRRDGTDAFDSCDYLATDGGFASCCFSDRTVVPGSSSAIDSELGAGRSCDDVGLILTGSVAGLTGVKVAPCADLPV